MLTRRPLTEKCEHGSAYAEGVFGPAAPVRAFTDVEQAIDMARDPSCGLSLGILTRDLEVADRTPSGVVHINDQTVSDEAVAPLGGVGTGSRFRGAQVSIGAFSEGRCVTMHGSMTSYPF